MAEFPSGGIVTNRLVVDAFNCVMLFGTGRERMKFEKKLFNLKQNLQFITVLSQ